MSLPHLILGLLSEQPMSGYDLDKAMQQGIAYFWTTDRSQIYRTLQKLKKKGWVRDERVAQMDVPDKKVYHVTETGQAELHRWLSTPMPTSEAPVREGWLGQLFFANHVDLVDTLRVVDAYIAETDAAVSALKSLKARVEAQFPPRVRQTPAAQLRFMTIDYGVSVQSAFVEWLREARERIALLIAQAGSQGGDHTPEADLADPDSS